MPLNLTVTGADFSANNLGRVVKLTSDRTGLVGEYIFGRNRATSLINGVDGGITPTVNVDPTYGDHRASVDAATSKYFNTLVADADDLTLALVLAYPANAYASRTLFGTGVGHKLNMYATASPGVRLQVVATDATAPEAVLAAPQAPLTDFRMLTGRINGPTNISLEVDEFKGGERVQNVLVETVKSRVPDTTPIAIGTLLNTTTYALGYDVAAALIWHRTLSDAELLAAYLEVREVLGGMGIAC